MEKTNNGKTTLSEAIDFCTRSSDEEDIANDDGVFPGINNEVVADSAMFCKPEDMLSENKNQDFTFEEGQSDDE